MRMPKTPYCSALTRCCAEAYHACSGPFLRDCDRCDEPWLPGADRPSRREQPPEEPFAMSMLCILLVAFATTFVPQTGNPSQAKPAAPPQAALVAPPLDPLAPASVPSPPRHRDELVDDRIAWIERLDPTHPIRRHPERYGLLTDYWMRTSRVTSRRTIDRPG